MVDFNNIDFETVKKPEKIGSFDFEGTGDIPAFIQEVKPSFLERGMSVITNLLRTERVRSEEKPIMTLTEAIKTGVAEKPIKDIKKPVFLEPVGEPGFGLEALGVPFIPMQAILEAPGAVTEAGLAERPEALEEKGPSILDIAEQAGQKLAVAFPGGYTAEDAGEVLDLDPKLAGKISRVAVELGVNWLYAGGVLRLLGGGYTAIAGNRLFKGLEPGKRQIVVQGVEDMVQGMKTQGVSEAQILRAMKNLGEDELAFERFAKQQGIKTEKPIKPKPEPKEKPFVMGKAPKEPVPEPKTKLAKEVAKDIAKERKPSSLATLAKRETEIVKDEIDFEAGVEKPVVEPKPISEPVKKKEVAPTKLPEAVEAKKPIAKPKSEAVLVDKIDKEIDRLLYAPLMPKGKTRYAFKTKTEIRDFTKSFKRGVSGENRIKLHGVAQKYQKASDYGWEQGRRFAKEIKKDYPDLKPTPAPEKIDVALKRARVEPKEPEIKEQYLRETYTFELSKNFTKTKQNALAAIDNAIKDAPIDKNDWWIKFIDPETNAEYKVVWNKYKLQEFKKRYKSLMTPVPKKAALKKKPVPKPKGLQEYWSQKERLIDFKNGWISDGDIAIKSVPPKGKIGWREEKPDFSIVQSLYKDKEGLTSAEIRYYTTTDPDIGEAIGKIPPVKLGKEYKVNVVFKAGKRRFVYDAQKVQIIKNRYPDAVYKLDVTPDKGHPLVAYDKGKPVAVLMSVEWYDEGKFAKAEKEVPGLKMAHKEWRGTTILYSGVPVHELSKASKGLKATYQKHIGDPLWKALSETLPEGAGKRSQIVDAINKGLIVDYRKDPDFIELRDEMLFNIEKWDEKSKELARILKEFPRAEQIRISQIIKGSVTVTPKRYEHALDAVKQFKMLEKELKRLKVLGPDNIFTQLTRKELATKFKEIESLGKQIETLKKRLKPVVKYSRMVRMVSEDVSEEVLLTVTETTTGKFKTESTKWTGLIEKRIKEALISRGFAEGEANQMISRVKESVVEVEGEEGTLKEITTKIEKIVTKTITQEIEKLKTYSPSMMARARGSLLKDIHKKHKERSAILERISIHYKMSGKQYLRRAYESIENEKGFLKKLTSYAAKRPRLKKGYDIRRKDLSHHYRQFLGEIKQAPYLVYKGLSEEYHDMFMMQMFERIAKNRKWAVSPKEWDNAMKIKARGKQQELYKDFKPLPQTDKLGLLSGAMVDPYIWDDLNEAVKQIHPMVKAHDQLLRLWKIGKVPFNPATQVRNCLSNTMLADLVGDLPPHRVDIYAEAARDFFTKSGYWFEAKQTPLLGKEWIGAEVSEFLTDVSELKNGNMTVHMANLVKKLLNKPLKVYQGIEQFFKLAVFISERKKGATIKEAYKKSEKAIFNYQKIPPAIRWAKRYYSPFITFSFKAMPRMAEVAIRKPWKFVKYGMLMLAVEEITRRMYGESKEEVEREKKVLPDYMRKTVLPGQLSHLRVPYKDKYNRSKYLDLSFILPWGDIAEQWGQSHFVGRPFLPSHPFWITVGEIAFNEVLFTGQELTVKDLDEGSEYLKKLGVQIWRQAAPSLAGSYSYNKLMAALYGERDWALRERSVGEAVFDVFFGLKIRSIDYNQEHARRIKNLKSKIDEIRDRFSYDYEKIFIRNPTPDYEKDQQRYLKIVERKDKAIQRIMDKITEIEE